MLPSPPSLPVRADTSLKRTRESKIPCKERRTTWPSVHHYSKLRRNVHIVITLGFDNPHPAVKRLDTTSTRRPRGGCSIPTIWSSSIVRGEGLQTEPRVTQYQSYPTPNQVSNFSVLVLLSVFYHLSSPELSLTRLVVVCCAGLSTPCPL